MKRGQFITVEGSDGAGKSTQLDFIEQWLGKKGISVDRTREPGGTETGEMIREILLKSADLAISDLTELLLIFSSRMQHLEERILPALNTGKWVLCDRFTDASYAYQGGGRGIDAEKIRQLENWVQDGLQPDLTLIYDVSVETGLNRTQSRGGTPDRFEKQDHAFKKAVRQAYLDRASRFPDRIKVIDASQSIADVETQTGEVLDQFVPSISTNYPDDVLI